MNKKLKVAILSNGISQHTLNRLNLFCEYPQLDVYFLHQSAQMKNNSKVPNERFYQFNVKKGKNTFERGLIGLNIIKQNVLNLLQIKPDIIFIMYGEKLSLVSALLSGKPYVISAWGGDFLIDQGAQKTWKDKMILQWGVKKAVHIFAVSEELVSTISILRGNNKLPQIQQLFYGINLNLYAFNNSPKIDSFEIYAPRWCRPEYNLLGLLEAFNLLKKMNSGATLLFRSTDVNDSDISRQYYKEALDFIEKNNLNNSTDIIGVLSENDHIKSLENTSVIISLAPSDGTPVTILEAMALGKIVVCGRINSLEKLIDDGKTGFLVDINNPEEIAQKLYYIEQNFGVLQKEIGQNARKFVEQYANIHREVDVYVSKFEELASSSKNIS
jgi:glycosyltransferase involved in cell wall biosynthesis